MVTEWSELMLKCFWAQQLQTECLLEVVLTLFLCFKCTLVLKVSFRACDSIQAACPALTTGGRHCSVQATLLMFDTSVASVILFSVKRNVYLRNRIIFCDDPDYLILNYFILLFWWMEFYRKLMFISLTVIPHWCEMLRNLLKIKLCFNLFYGPLCHIMIVNMVPYAIQR